MNNALMFSSKSDEWATPQDTFDAMHREFQFDVDLAASQENTKCEEFYSIEKSALAAHWAEDFPDGIGWCNPPYSRGLQGKFIEKAAAERLNGFTTVMLLPARTDTRAFHTHIYDETTWSARKGVEIRFLRGRLKFGGAKDSAPFPSMIVVFRP
jgi:phage N-6-adenine-methyltransferase